MSAANASTAWFPVAARMSAAACSVRARSRPVTPTRAPIEARPIAVALPMPPVPPVISTCLPAIGVLSPAVLGLNRDDNRSPRMPVSHVTDRPGGRTQRVRSIDERCDLSGFDELLEDEQVSPILKLDRWAKLLAPELRRHRRF